MGQEEDLGLEMLEVGLKPGAGLSLSPCGCLAHLDQEGQDPHISQQNLWLTPQMPSPQPHCARFTVVASFSLKQEASPQRQGAGEGEEQRRVWNVGGEQGR